MLLQKGNSFLRLFLNGRIIAMILDSLIYDNLNFEFLVYSYASHITRIMYTNLRIYLRRSKKASYLLFF
jgi:hypothetical protein